MEQVYNHTQDKPSYHDRGIRNKAADIQSKANQLNTTADSHSGTELTTIKNTDIQNDTTPGSELTAKAQELMGAASNLHGVANALATTKENPLKPLKGPAGNLKDEAKKESPGGEDTDGLYGAAKALESAGSIGLEALAKKVIEKFEAVASAYGALMEKAKKIKQQTHPSVTAVTREYNELKAIYDQMLNLTKLANAATALKTAANSSAPNLQHAAGQLKDNVTALRDSANTGHDYIKAQTVIQNFETVENAYKALGDKTVKDKFEALKALYDQILKFTKVKHYSEQLHTAANGVNAKDVITNFNAVVDAYNALGDNKSIVKSEFDNLQKEYSKAIYVYKWYFISLPSS